MYELHIPVSLEATPGQESPVLACPLHAFVCLCGLSAWVSSVVPPAPKAGSGPCYGGRVFMCIIAPGQVTHPPCTPGRHLSKPMADPPSPGARPSCAVMVFPALKVGSIAVVSMRPMYSACLTEATEQIKVTKRQAFCVYVS